MNSAFASATSVKAITMAMIQGECRSGSDVGTLASCLEGGVQHAFSDGGLDAHLQGQAALRRGGGWHAHDHWHLPALRRSQADGWYHGTCTCQTVNGYSEVECGPVRSIVGDPQQIRVPDEPIRIHRIERTRHAHDAGLEGNALEQLE